MAYSFDLTVAWAMAVTAFAIMFVGGPGSVLGAVVMTCIPEALRFLEPRSMPAVVALRSDGDLRGVPFEAVQARAYWELITCVVTPPETGQGVQP